MAADKAFSGRKVFFLNPTPFLEENIVEQLRVMEYDAYSVHDYRIARNIATVHSEGVWFVVPNEALTHTGWHNFIMTLETGDSLVPPIDVGIIMRGMTEESEKKFLVGLKCAGGVMKLKESANVLLQTVKETLDRLGAIGLRKNIRADCMADKSAEIYWMKESKMFRFKMIDISTAAIATTFPGTLQNEVFVNQVIPDAYITMGKKQLGVPLKISTIKTAGDKLLVIFMYGDDVPPEAMMQIREYIGTVLRTQLKDAIKNMPKDKLDYNNM